MKFSTTTVASLMTREVLAVGPTASLRSAAEIMNDNRVHSVLVHATDPRRLPGIITGKDIANALGQCGTRGLDELCVADACTSPVYGIASTLTLQDAINLMRMAGVRSAAVFDAGEVVGFLTFTDILRYATTFDAAA